jgi:hypothetical protein
MRISVRPCACANSSMRISVRPCACANSSMRTSVRPCACANSSMRTSVRPCACANSSMRISVRPCACANSSMRTSVRPLRLCQLLHAHLGASLRLRQVALCISDLLNNRLQFTEVASLGNIGVCVVNRNGKCFCLARCKDFLKAVGQVFNT